MVKRTHSKLCRSPNLRAITVLSIIVLLISMGCASFQNLPTTNSVDNREKFRIGACPVESIDKTQDQLQTFIKYLEKKTGYKVELTVASDYRSIINGMRNKEIDVAWFGPFSYVIAHNEAGAHAFAGAENSKSGKTYQSIFIAHPDTRIETIQQLRGRRLAYTDPDSTSGFLVPKATLLKNNLDPDKDLETVFLGHHDAAVLAVKKRSVDAASVSSIILQNMREKGLVGDKDYRIIYVSEAIPGSGAVWAYRDGISTTMLAKIKEAFFTTKHEEASLGIFGKEIGTFFPVTDREFDIIRETSRLLGMNAN